jgi:23S rRNA pseudouridine1911/1915/1917 synthase
VRTLKRLFAERDTLKTYRAVVEGLPADACWTVDAPLGFEGGEVRIKMGRGDLPAETRFEVVRRGHRRALVTAQPISGRQHQIRVHAALSGHPLVGDKLYGPDDRYFLRHLEGELGPADFARLGHTRQALHAARIAFDWKGAPRVFESPWPSELDALVL